MKKTSLISLIALLFLQATFAQITRSAIKKDTAVKTIKQAPVTMMKTVPTQSSSTPASVYTLTSARVTIKTGNDNKESPSKFIIYIMENKSIWSEGSELFTQQNHQGSTAELRVNSSADISMQKSGVNTSPDAYTLDNLQNKGLKFIIWYWPNFFADAWKIETVTLTLEFKDQYGALHPNYGQRIIQYNLSNGLLTKANPTMIGTTDAFFTPQPVTITEKFW